MGGSGTVTPIIGTPSSGGLVVGPTIEPITMAELKTHLRVDSETLDGNLTLTQSLGFGSHVIANNYTTHTGTGIYVLGSQAEVELHCGTNGATGTNDTVIQEADALAGPYTNWTGGIFATVNTGNDNSDYKIQYTGTKAYIRTASKVLLAACEFGTSILVNAATNAEDDLLTSILITSREITEDITRRRLLTQTWDYVLQSWPSKNYFKLPYGNLQSVTSVKYKDTAGVEYTLVNGTDYIVETNGPKCGKVVLPYSGTWPTTTLYPSNPIAIRFVCGWTTAANVPSKLKTAQKMVATDLWENRETQIISTANVQSYAQNKTIGVLTFNDTLWEEL